MKKILFYNWIPFDEKEGKGGGVTVYVRNLIACFIRHPEWQVYFLSSGRAYNYWKKGPYIERTENIFGKACKSYRIVNSPIFSSARISFPFPKDYLTDRSLLEVILDFLQKEGRMDIIHFQNFEGLSLSVFELKRYVPDTKIIYSLHNYYLFCPQVMLWRGEERCMEKHCGLSCLECSPGDVYKKKVKFNQNYNYFCEKGMTPQCRRVWDMLQKAVAWMAERYSQLHRDKFGNPALYAKLYADFETKNVEAANRYVDRFLAVSERVAEIAIQKGIVREKILINYIGTEAAQNRNQKQKCRYTGGVFHIAYFGYMRKMKGFYFLLDALENMNMELAVRIGVCIAAPGTDEEARERIKKLEEKFADVAYYDGYTHSQMKEILAHIHLGIVPVLWEDNLPQVAIEMKAYGVAVLCSNLGGAKELSPTEDFVFQAGNRRDFYRKLEKLVNHPNLLEAYFSGGREPLTTEEHFSQLINIYEG
ncbi:MAG: glycosyltransferase family 4 protein [Lachnospiraceae bacterium]|nr:glycosyltransferase family 4 protein [Lachnospiraceae bacterium]